MVIIKHKDCRFFVLSLFLFLLISGISGCVIKEPGFENFVHFGHLKLSDSIDFDVRINKPQGRESDLLALYVLPSISKQDTITSENDSACFAYKLKQEFLKNGISWMDVYNRKDSVAFSNSTCYTKADDVIAAIDYIKSKLHLNKRIVLVGQSEGGMTSAMVASVRDDISGLVFISTPGVRGSQFLHYQDSIALRRVALTLGLEKDAWQFIYNLSPFLGKTYPTDTLGIQAYYNDLAAPLHRIMDRGNNIDSISVSCMNFLQNCWQINKDSIRNSKINYNQEFGFDEFLKSYRYKMYTMPNQIALYNWDPTLYFPKIRCPVMAVFGTLDEQIEYSGSLKNMEVLLKTGGNINFTVQVLEGYNHVLSPAGRKSGNAQNDGVKEIVKWAIRLPEQ